MTTTLTFQTKLTAARQREALEAVLGPIDTLPLSGALTGQFLAYAQGFRVSGSQPHSATYEELEGRGPSEDGAISALFDVVAQHGAHEGDNLAAKDGIYVRLSRGGQKIAVREQDAHVTGFALTPHIINF